MEIANRLFLSGSAAEQEFDFRIPFLQVDRAHYRVKASVGQRTPPHIDVGPVAARGPFEVSVIQGIDDGGMPRMAGTPRAFNHEFR
jgi:hypothetical protein